MTAGVIDLAEWRRRHVRVSVQFQFDIDPFWMWRASLFFWTGMCQLNEAPEPSRK